MFDSPPGHQIHAVAGFRIIRAIRRRPPSLKSARNSRPHVWRVFLSLKAVMIAPEIGIPVEVTTLPVSVAFVDISSPCKCTVGSMMDISASRVTVRWPVKKPLGAKITPRTIIIPNAFAIRLLQESLTHHAHHYLVLRTSLKIATICCSVRRFSMSVPYPEKYSTMLTLALR